MARIGSKRQVAIDIMNENGKKPMADVIALIAKANDIDAGAARSYYVYIVKNGMAKGKIEAAPKAEKAPKAAKEKAVKRMAKEAAAKAVKAVKPSVPVKSAEEIERIKAANLARMKTVLGKVKQNVKVEDAPAFAETDSFDAPAFLTKDEVESLV